MLWSRLERSLFTLPAGYLPKKDTADTEGTNCIFSLERRLDAVVVEVSAAVRVSMSNLLQLQLSGSIPRAVGHKSDALDASKTGLNEWNVGINVDSLNMCL